MQVFNLANQVEGIGSDSTGEFTLSGNYTDHEVFFVVKFKTLDQPSRTFAGTRKRTDMSISGRWWVSDGGCVIFLLSIARNFCGGLFVEVRDTCSSCIKIVWKIFALLASCL